MSNKPPPCALEAEMATAGCVLLDPASSLAVLSRHGIGPSHFFDLRCAAVIRIEAELHRNGSVVDDILVLPRLQAVGVGAEWNFLETCRTAAPSAANVEYYLPDLQSAYIKRAILRLHRELSRLMEENLILNDEAIQEILAKIEKLGQKLGAIGSNSDGLPSIVSASEFMAADLPDAPEVIDGILHKGSKLVLSGASKAGKTWLLMDLATAVACGTEWLGIPTAQGRVLYLNMELTPRMFQKRLGYIIHAKGISGADLGSLDVWNLRGKTSPWNIIIPKIRTLVKTAGYRLIIVDPLYRLYGALKENSAEDMAILTNALGDLAEESGAATAIATHHSKCSQVKKEAIDRISGSGVIARDADALMDFTANGVEDAYSASLRVRDFKPVRDFAVSWQFPLFRRDDKVNPANLKTTAGRKDKYDTVTLLSSILDRTAQNPISINDWALLANVPRGTMSSYTQKFRLKGWTMTIGEGNKAGQFITPKGIAFVKENGGAND